MIDSWNGCLRQDEATHWFYILLRDSIKKILTNAKILNVRARNLGILNLLQRSMLIIPMQFKKCHILIQNIDRIAYIYRTDLEVQKLNINDESTRGIYLNRKSKVV